MKILICSDGSPQAENAIRFGARIAAACQADTALLGIMEDPARESVVIESLRGGQQLLKDNHVNAELITKAGRPVVEIVKRTEETEYDLVVIGAVRKGTSRLFWMSARVYRIIEAVEPPVLVVPGDRPQLKRVLVCSGGAKYINKAVQLTGQIAQSLKAGVTLLHVMAEPPAMYADLIQIEEDTDRLLRSNSELGRNLKREKELLEEMDVSCDLRLRHGLVVAEILKELRSQDYDMVVTGSYPVRDKWRSYMLGNVTREIVNRSVCPVLVVRSDEEPQGFLDSLKSLTAELFGKRKAPAVMAS